MQRRLILNGLPRIRRRAVEKKPNTRLARRNGFILIEALAAFTILTLVLATLMFGVFGAVHNDDRAAFMLRASRTARSQLDAIGVASPPSPGLSEGRTDDGLTYSIAVSYIDPPPTANPSGPKILAFWAHIDVSRSGNVTGKALHLGYDTFKVVALDEGRR